jgi:hypothetical protein
MAGHVKPVLPTDYDGHTASNYDAGITLEEILVHWTPMFDPVGDRCATRSNKANGVAERWIGSCRRKLLNHVIVLGETHLGRLIRDYIS